VTLADSTNGTLEEDGLKVFGKKTLSKLGKLQNYVFTLQSRSMISADQLTLNKASVCGVSNTDTKLHLSTQLFTEKNGDEDSESDEEEGKGETENEKK
jgi:hypothetical protein